MKKKAQYGLKEKGVFLNSNVNNRQVPVRLNSGEIIYVDSINGRTLDSDSIIPSNDSTYVDRGMLSNKATTFKSNKQNKIPLKTKKQFGGTGQEVIVEDGEVFLDEFGNVVESNSFDHEDNFILLPDGSIGKASNGNGGELVNAQSVVSDSFEKVKDGDRKNTEKEKVLKFTPKESNELLKSSGLHWFKAKGSMSPSELIKEAIDQTTQFSTKLDKDVPYDQYGKNSQNANKSQIPNEEELYNLVFQEQEARKQMSGLFEDENYEDAQYGKKQPIYVDSVNDPRYKAYSDSLNLYNRGERDFKRYEDQNQKYNIPEKSKWSLSKGYIPNQRIQPISSQGVWRSTGTSGNTTVTGTNIGEGLVMDNTFRYKKPTQRVEVRPSKTKLPDVEEISGDQQVNLPLPKIQIPANKPMRRLPTDGHTYYQNPGESNEDYRSRLNRKNYTNYQYGGLPISYNGLLEFPDQAVVVPDGNITMEEINYPVNAYDADTYEFLETMQPGENYQFNADNILEIPVNAKYGMKKAQSGIDNRSYEVALNSLQNLLKNAKTVEERNLIQSRIVALNKQLPPLDTEATIPEPYIIQQGDSLSKVANDYGLSVDDLMKANPELVDKNRIIAGDTLNIPELTIKGQSPVAKTWDGLKDFDAQIRADNRFGNIKPVEQVERISEPNIDEYLSSVNNNRNTVVSSLANAVNNFDPVNIGRLDRTQGTNALRQMMQNNRSIALPYRQEVPNRTMNYIEEDVTPYLDEIDSSVAQQLQYVNPNTSQGQALLANISNRASQASRQTINRVNATNLQRRNQTDNQNVQLQNQFDLMQEQANKGYVDEVYQTIANQDRNKVQQAEYLDDMINMNSQTNNAFLMSNIKNPNFQIDAKGNINRIAKAFNSGVSNSIDKAYSDLTSKQEDLTIEELEALLKKKKKAKYGLKKKI